MGFAGGYGSEGLFSNERTLKGRQLELDAVRGLSVFLMVGAHVFNQFQPIAGTESGFDIFSQLAGAFPGGANCFMMVMGMVMLFSTTSTYKHFISRGALLIVAGFGIGIIRVLPGVINYLITGNFVSFFPEYSYADPIDLMTITIFWQDILIFAGMAMVFLGLVQKIGMKDLHLLILTVAMMVINEFLIGIHNSNDVLNIIEGYFFGTTVFDGSMTTSRYPFFSWILFPVSGYLMAKYLIRTTDKRRFYRNVALWCFIAILPLTIYGIFSGMFNDSFTGMASYHLHWYATLWCTFAGILWIALWYFICSSINQKYFSPLCRWSRNITWIYIFHFAILSVAIQLLPRSFDIIGCLVIYFVLFIIVDYLAEMMTSAKRKQKSSA